VREGCERGVTLINRGNTPPVVCMREGCGGRAEAVQIVSFLREVLHQCEDAAVCHICICVSNIKASYAV
jgi:hypothetical protein